jgi:hypothetical protein
VTEHAEQSAGTGAHVAPAGVGVDVPLPPPPLRGAPASAGSAMPASGAVVVCVVPASGGATEGPPTLGCACWPKQIPPLQVSFDAQQLLPQRVGASAEQPMHWPLTH